MSLQPTHTVTYKSWSVSIKIHPRVWERAQSTNLNTSDRKKARSSICIHVKSAIAAKYSLKGLGFIKWGDLSIEPATQSRSTQNDPTKPAIALAERGCECADSCATCDIGDHHRCKRCRA